MGVGKQCLCHFFPSAMDIAISELPYPSFDPYDLICLHPFVTAIAKAHQWFIFHNIVVALTGIAVMIHTAVSVFHQIHIVGASSVPLAESILWLPPF